MAINHGFNDTAQTAPLIHAVNDTPTHAAHVQKSSLEVIAELMDGNARFLSGETAQSPESSLNKLKAFAKSGQLPKAIILCCSDSRAPVEVIFDQDIGDLFVIRVAGNVVAPSLVGSVEFALSSFNAPLVMVMGHTQCGAVRATLEQIENPQLVSTENIHDIVSRIRPNIYTIATLSQIPQAMKFDLAVHSNVRASVSQLSHASRLIESYQQAGKVKIVGAVMNLDSGKVELLND